MATKKTASKFQELGLRDLLDYTNMTSLVCSRYEKGLRNYDGSINYAGVDNSKFTELTHIYYELLDECEARIRQLEQQ